MVIEKFYGTFLLMPVMKLGKCQEVCFLIVSLPKCLPVIGQK